MKTSFVLALTVLTLGLNVSAKDKKAAAVETYKVDAAASTVNWKGTKKLGSFHEGTWLFRAVHSLLKKTWLNQVM